MGFLIDTCVWIEVERGAAAPADVAAFTGQDPVFLSPVTLAELTFGVEMATDPKIRLKRIFSTSPGWTWSYSPSLLSPPPFRQRIAIFVVRSETANLSIFGLDPGSGQVRVTTVKTTDSALQNSRLNRLAASVSNSRQEKILR